VPFVQGDRPPRRLDQPVLGGLASGFPTTARSSAFLCSTEKSVNSYNGQALGSEKVGKFSSEGGEKNGDIQAPPKTFQKMPMLLNATH
jgi:hypothetical protein